MKATIRAAIAIIAVAAPVADAVVVAPVGAATALSACTATSGVTVIVDFTHFSGGRIERGCAPGHPVNGLAALHAAGFASAGTTQYGDAFVCRIDGLPRPKQDACAITPSPTAFWAYWNARPADTKWTYSSVGVLDFRPKAGTIEAFAFGNHAQPGIAPSAAIVTTTTTSTRSTRSTTTTVAPPATRPPPVTAATLPSAPDTTDVPVVALEPTTTVTTVRSTPKSTTTTRPAAPTSSTLRVVDRSASGPAPPDSSGSPLAAILTAVIVGGLGIGAFAFSRARRRRPA